MGDFRVVVEAVGGHGCSREVRDGGTVNGCGRMSCPDCIAREFVDTLKRKGVYLRSAILTHWPGSATEVEDDLLSRIRRGTFPEAR